jgi:phosphate uptake regulator
MEERKLIKLGNSSFAIALPKAWVDKAGLRKGDKIFLEHNGNGEITVSSKFKKEEEKKIEINVDGKDTDSIKNHLRAAYTKGYSTVIFKGELKNRKMIDELIKEYLSFEIMETNKNEIIAKDLFDLNGIKFENLIRRIDNCLREMFDITLAETNKPKPEPKNLKELDETDNAVNKFYFLCSRIFRRGIDNPAVLNTLKISGNRLFSNWLTSFYLESLGDGLKYTLRWIDKLNPKKKEEIYSILILLQQAYVKSMDAFYSETPETAFTVLEDTKKIKGMIEQLEEDHKMLKITESLELVRRNIYQNAKMTFYIKY